MRLKTALIRLLLLLPALSMVTVSMEGRSYLGGLFSAKGTGISSVSMEGERPSSIQRSDLLLDMHGIFRGWNTLPGLRLRYTNEYILARTDLSTGTKIAFAAGPGMSVGYVSDSDNVYGFLGALSAETSLLFDFKRQFCICVSFSADFGMHCRYTDRHAILRSYRNGLYKAYFPELTLLYRF